MSGMKEVALPSKILFAEEPNIEAPQPPFGVNTLPELFRHQAQTEPDATLFSFKSESKVELTSLTYGQVFKIVTRLSSKVSNFLKRISNIQSNDSRVPLTAPVVGIWFEKSIELHLAILSASTAGATWLPFDPEAPTSRATACLSDSSARVLLCDDEHKLQALEAVDAMGKPATVITFSQLVALPESDKPSSSSSLLPTPSNAAYMIYTSGSTGTPKGIEIPHSAALTFALSERLVLGTNQNDIVWQGFSPAFDMFIEETWVSIAGGAHIAIGNRHECRDVASLGGRKGIWASRGVTIVNTVPTLINIMTSLDFDGESGGLPQSVRLLNLGGEACPPALVETLWKPSLKILNTYGPSETTVTATYAVLEPTKPVTIGKPLPSYHAALLPIIDDGPPDMTLQDLYEGVEGELCIGGACIGSGYVKRPELTAEKFIPHPTLPNQRLYRTGDRVRLDSANQIHFLGRIDTQVKHRGFRIELGEIESVLASHPNVQTAAVILAKAGQEEAKLEAFVTGRERFHDATSLRECLSCIPSYMQPEAFHFLSSDEMPRLPSGKINAKALHQLSEELKSRIAREGSNSNAQVHLQGEETEPGTNLATLMVAMAAIFPQQANSGLLKPSSDFFDDLGGHSLAAAVLVSRLRKEAAPGSSMSSIGLQHIYESRTPQSLANQFAEEESDDDEKESFDEKVKDNGPQTGDYWPIPTWRFVLCGVAQLPALLFFFFINSVALLSPYLIFYTINERLTIGYAILVTYGAFVVIPIWLTAIGVVGKWFALGRAKQGEYPLYGLYYYRWWLACRFVDLIDVKNVGESALYPILLRALGAKIGSHCHLSNMLNGPAMDLVAIGDDVVIGREVFLAVECVERGRLILKPISIGSEAHVGSNSVLEGGSCMQEAAELHALSMLPDGAVVPRAERWHGSPARFQLQAMSPYQGRPSRPSTVRYGAMALANFVCVTFIIPLLYFAPQIPSLLLFEVASFESVGIGGWAQTAIVSIPASLAYLLLVFIELVVIRHAVLGKVRPGTYKLTSFFFLRKWLVDRLMDLSLIVLHPVYASLYVVPYLRALGVNIGKWAEVSTARGVGYNLVDIGDEAFIADAVLVGNAQVRANEVALEKTRLQARAFAGNASLLPQGTDLASNTLVGVLSIAPSLASEALKPGQSCFGSPPVRMPARQQATREHAEHLLYKPRASQIVMRLFIEGCRIWVPRMLVVFALGFGLEIYEVAYPHIGIVYTLLMLPFFFLFLFALPALFVIIIVKWALVGRYSLAEWPLWSHKVWLSEAVTSTYESLLAPMLTSLLVGTPYLAWVFRALGVKIGSRCTLLSHDITEHDMVSLGDESVINMHSGPQTHLFEDRVMKVGSVQLEKRAVMKSYSICLPNSVLGEETQLGSLSLVMKGESVPAKQAWEGTPISPRQKRNRVTVSTALSSPSSSSWSPENTAAFSSSPSPPPPSSSSSSSIFTTRPRGAGHTSSRSTSRTVYKV